MNNISLNDLNIYAAQTLDRYHLNHLNISFDNQQIVDINNQEKDIEQWTVDNDTAFQIGWDLQIVPQIQQLCIQQAKQVLFIRLDLKRKYFSFDLVISSRPLSSD
jgi:hypothetical protein